MKMTAEDLIAILQEENSKMKELLEFANVNLSMLFHDIDKGRDINVKDVVAFIGTRIETFLNERG